MACLQRLFLAIRRDVQESLLGLQQSGLESRTGTSQPLRLVHWARAREAPTEAGRTG